MGKYMLPREHLDDPSQYEKKKRNADALVDFILNEMDGFCKDMETDSTVSCKSKPATIFQCCGYLTMPPYYVSNDQYSKISISCERDTNKRDAIKVTLKAFAACRPEDESENIKDCRFNVDNDDLYLLAEAFKAKGYNRGKVRYRHNRNVEDSRSVEDELVFSIVPLRAKEDKHIGHVSDYSGIASGPKVRTRKHGQGVRRFIPWTK